MKRLIRLFLFIFAAHLAVAHHGKDYLNTATCVLPHSGSMCAHLNTQYFAADHSLEAYQLFSPGIIYGVTDDLAMELHSHFIRTASSSTVEALAFEARYSFFTETAHHSGESAHPFSLAASAEFEQGFEDHPNTMESRIIIGKEMGFVALAGNMILVQALETDQHLELYFAVGMRTSVSRSVGMSVELLNGNHHSDGPQLGVSCSLSPLDNIDVRFGANITSEHMMTEFSSLQGMIMYSF